MVERLTKPIVVEPPKTNDHKTFDDSFEAAQVIDAATFIGSLQSGAQPTQAFQTPGAKSLRSGRMRQSGASVDSSDSPNNKNKSKQTPQEFERFLERQKIRVDKREERLKKVDFQFIYLFADCIHSEILGRRSNDSQLQA